MKTIELSMKKFSRIPLEFDNILPELLFDKTINEINDTIVYHGNRQEPLGDYFNIKVEGIASNSDDCRIILNGNLSRVKYIGNKMSAGEIIVNSDVDLHVAAEMSNGHIIVNGDAESYAAREMTGGLLEIHGDVKHFCASSYMGQWRGVSGGKIVIDGNVGRNLAESMVAGEIYIKGNCDILLGVHMSNGFIQIDGNVSKWPAGQMKSGTIVINGEVGEILEGFRKKEIVTHPYINGRYYIGRYSLYIGDIGANGKGEVWIKIDG